MLNLYAPEPWSEVAPGLYVGGHDYQPPTERYPAPAVVADEFDVVISLYRRDGHGPAEGVLHIERLVLDAGLSAEHLRDMHVLADWAAESIRAGLKVLCRCQAGLNRSSLVAALAMVRLGHGPGEAIEQIRVRRSPNALFNHHFVRYIHDSAAVSAR
jgi:protein-tyrosine phosphatase